MFSLNERHQYYLYESSTDMRKGFDGLSGLVRNELDKNPLSGDVYIFINRGRNRMKLLVWEEGGFVLYYKRLEREKCNHILAAINANCQRNRLEIGKKTEAIFPKKS